MRLPRVRPPSVRPPRDLSSDVLAMAGVAFCVALGFGVVAPTIPLFAHQFGVGATAAGAVVSAFALARLVSALGAGRLVGKVGERTGVLVGLAVVAVSSLLAGLSQTYAQLIILRGIGGVGSAVFGVAAVSLVLRVATTRMRARSMSVYRSGFLVGGMVGPAFGGAVLGISLRAPFFLYAGTLTLAGVVALVFLTRRGTSARPRSDSGAETEDTSPEEPADEDAKASDTSTGADEQLPERSFRDVLRTREYQAALVANLAVGVGVFGLRNAIVPLLFVEHIGTASYWSALALLVSAVVQTGVMYPAGRWGDIVGRRPALLVGVTVTAGGLMLLGTSGTLLVGLVAMAVFGFGSAFLGSIPGALVGDVAGQNRDVIPVFNMASDAGAVTAPVLAGLLVDHGSFLAAFALGAGVVLAAGVFALRLPRAHAALQR